MNQIIEALKQHIESIGCYFNVEFEERNEDSIYFTALDINKQAVSIKADIDDEMTYDDWSLWEKSDGMLQWVSIEV